MALQTANIHRNLESKLKLFGFEAFDLLAVLIFAAIMNLFFGKLAIGVIFTLFLPLLGLVVLYFGKKNKPDSYILHLVQSLLFDGYLSAGEESQYEYKMRRKIYEC